MDSSAIMAGFLSAGPQVLEEQLRDSSSAWTLSFHSAVLSDRTRFSLFLDVAVDGAGEGANAPIFEFRLVTTLTSASDKVTLCPDQSPRARASNSFCIGTQILFDSKKDLVALQHSAII